MELNSNTCLWVWIFNLPHKVVFESTTSDMKSLVRFFSKVYKTSVFSFHCMKGFDSPKVIHLEKVTVRGYWYIYVDCHHHIIHSKAFCPWISVVDCPLNESASNFWPKNESKTLQMTLLIQISFLQKANVHFIINCIIDDHPFLLFLGHQCSVLTIFVLIDVNSFFVKYVADK